MSSEGKQFSDWSDVRDDVLYSAEKGRVLPFFGAALSFFAPTALPLGRGLLDAALEGIFPKDRWSSFAPDKQTRDSENLRINSRSAEVVLQGLAEGLLNRDRLADFYNEMCNIPFNPLHTLVMRALHKASVPAVFTTNQDRCLEDAALDQDRPIQPIFDVAGFDSGMQRTVFQFHGAIGGVGDEKERRSKSLTFTLNSMGPRLPEAKKRVLETGLEQNTLLFMGYSGWDPDIWYSLDDYLEAHPDTHIYWCVKSPVPNDSLRHVLRLQQRKYRKPDTVRIFTADMRDVLRELATAWGLQDPGEPRESTCDEKEVRLDGLRHWIPDDELRDEERQLAYGWLLVSVGLHNAACRVLESLAQKAVNHMDQQGRYMYMMSSLFAGYARRELSDHRKAQKHLMVAAKLGQELDRVRYAQAIHKLGESLATFESIHLWYALPEIEWLHPGAYWLNRAIAEYRQLRVSKTQLLTSEQLGRAGLGNALLNLGQLYRRIAWAAKTLPIIGRFWRRLLAKATQLMLQGRGELEGEGDMRSLTMAIAASAPEEHEKTEEQTIKRLEDSIEIAEQWNQDDIQIGLAYFAKAQFVKSQSPVSLEKLVESERLYMQALHAFRNAEMKAEIVRTELDLAGVLNSEARETMRTTESSWEWQFGLRFLGVAKALLPLLRNESLFGLALLILVLGWRDCKALVEFLLAVSLSAVLIILIVVLYEIYRAIRQ